MKVLEPDPKDCTPFEHTCRNCGRGLAHDDPCPPYEAAPSKRWKNLDELYDHLEEIISEGEPGCASQLSAQEVIELVEDLLDHHVQADRLAVTALKVEAIDAPHVSEVVDQVLILVADGERVAAEIKKLSNSILMGC